MDFDIFIYKFDQSQKGLIFMMAFTRLERMVREVFYPHGWRCDLRIGSTAPQAGHDLLLGIVSKKIRVLWTFWLCASSYAETGLSFDTIVSPRYIYSMRSPLSKEKKSYLNKFDLGQGQNFKQLQRETVWASVKRKSFCNL